MYIKRFLEDTISKYINKKEIVAIIGPRQSGKTTLLKHIFSKLKNAVFLDFEDREILEIFSQDIKNFVDLYIKGYKYIFIDEFQYASNGGKNLKYIYDNYGVKIFISGSSASGLSIHGIKYLVGRVFVFNLHPFSFEEFLSYKDQKLYEVYKKGNFGSGITNKILAFFNEFCIFGGYPRVITSSTNEEKQTVLKNIYNTYFLKEIKEILNLPDDYRLSKLIHVLALQISNVVNYNELSNITEFKYVELKRHLNILEKTFIIINSTPFFINKRTELVKSPKIFFLDNGFRNLVIKNFQNLKQRPDKGWLYENFVASELYKSDIALKYWRTKSKAEVDFIIEKNQKITPIEIKSGLKDIKVSKSFNSFIEKYHPKNSFILSESFIAKKKNISFEPIFCITKILKEV